MAIYEEKSQNINGNKGEGVNTSLGNSSSFMNDGFESGVLNNVSMDTTAYGTSLLFNNKFYREDSQELVDAIKFLEEHCKDKGLKFLAVDKTYDKKVKYSAVAICQHVNNKVYFFLVSLASTGREALTALEYFNTELNAKAKNDENTEAYTYFDNNNKALVGIAMDAIKNEYGEVKTHYCDAIMLRTSLTDVTTVKRLEFLARNLFVQARTEKDSGLFLNDITEKIGLTHEFVFDVSTVETDKYDELGNIFKSDFKAELRIQPKKNKLPEGSYIVDSTLVKVHGYITPQPTVITEEINGFRTNVNTMSPNIVITDIVSEYPDVSTNMLALIVGSIMTQENNWKYILTNKASELKIGALNKLLCLHKSDGDMYPEIDIDAGEAVNGVSYREQVIEEIFRGVPLVSFDITPYNYNTNTYLFTLLENPYALSDEMKAAVRACDMEFEEGLKKLFGKNFNYPENKILSRTVIPYGYIQNQKGEKRDLRKLSLCEVLSVSKPGDTTAINMIMETLRANNQNTFNVWIELLKNFYPTAVIEGKTHRVTFHNRFLNHFYAKFISVINNNLRSMNTYVAPRKYDMGQDYNIFSQEAINIYGMNQANANGFNYTFNQYNTQGYDGGKFFMN